MINDHCLVVVPRESDVAGARGGIEDLAFDAATGIAQMVGVQIASDEFNTLYREVVEAYQEASDYLYYFVHLGVVTFKNQMDSGHVRLIVQRKHDGDLDVDAIVEAILDAAKPIAAAFLHLTSVGNQMMIPDSEILDLPSGLATLGVEFHVGEITYGGNHQ